MRPTADILYAPLSGPQREVLRLVADGYSNRAIARRLFISQATVRSHLSTIYQKLGFSGMIDVNPRVLAALAFRDDREGID